MTNLASLNFASAADQGATMPVLHPIDRVPLLDAKKKPVTIDLLGRDSDTWIKGENAARNKSVEQLTTGAKYSAAAADRRDAESLARATTGWSGIPKAWLEEGSNDESPAEFSFENAVKLYTNRGVRWLRDDADKFVGTRANFLKASLTS